jgi:hypothetical protein
MLQYDLYDDLCAKTKLHTVSNQVLGLYLQDSFKTFYITGCASHLATCLKKRLE